MDWRRLAAGATLAIAFTLTGCGEKVSTVEDYQTRVVTFPNGKQVRAETMMNRADLTRGMMFRDSLAPDRGMLFLFPQTGRYKSFMFQVRIPLDVIWLDRDRRIVEIVPNAPPCTADAGGDCPLYGGNADSVYMLELNAGMAAKLGIKVGDTLQF